MAEMAKLGKKAKEAAKKEEEEVQLAAEKAVRKEAKQGEKHAVEESGANVGAEGSKPKKRVKTTEVGDEDESPLETPKVSCKR